MATLSWCHQQHDMKTQKEDDKRADDDDKRDDDEDEDDKRDDDDEDDDDDDDEDDDDDDDDTPTAKKYGQVCLTLGGWMNEPDPDNIWASVIDYAAVGQTDDDVLRHIGILGLKRWVHHSDSTGYLTPAEAREILDVLERIVEHLPKHWFNDEIKTPANWALRSVFNESIETRKNIIFC